MIPFAFYNSSMNTEVAPQPQPRVTESWTVRAVVITAETALRCFSLAAVSFWYRASSKLAAAMRTEPRHFGLSMAYPSRSLGLMWHHWDWLWPCLYTAVLVYLGFFCRPVVPRTSGVSATDTPPFESRVQPIRSLALIMVASMLVDLDWSRTFRLVMWSCHLIPRIERRGRMWKSSSFLIYLQYSVHVSQP